MLDHATPMMYEVTAEDKIRNEYMRNSMGVVSTVDKMRKNILRWLGPILSRT